MAGGLATAGLTGLAQSRRRDHHLAGRAGGGANPWDILARRLSGPLVRPGDRGYAALALPYNLRVASIRPAGIALCRDARDVATCIRWARKYRFPLIGRSGGHSAAGYSVTTGLMIDTRLMTHASFDARTGVATIAGGVLNAGVYQTLQQNHATITHGRCPTVGASGFLLGGGIGFNIRTLGIASDALVASQLVTADGDILRLSDRENRDLFWACRGGGGGNFGISTSFSIRTVPAPRSVTAANVTWTKKIDTVVPALLDALYDSPVGLGTWTTLDAVTPRQLARGKDVSVFFEGQLLGSPAELRRILAPAYAVQKPSESKIKQLGYWQAQRTFFSDVEKPSELQNRGFYFCGPISHRAIDIMLHWMRRWPGTSVYARVSFLRTGGRANSVPAHETAFVHRDNEWYMLWYLKWGRNDSKALVAENLAWLSDFYDAIAPFALPQTYQNFTDPSLRDYLAQYYGTNLPRLKRIKAAVDPTRVFDFPQAIPPAHHHRCP